MDFQHFGRKWTKRTYRLVRVLVRVIYSVIIVSILSYIYLRAFGIPQPVLRMALSRAEAAAVRIDVDEVRLTVKGWRAENLRYFSNNPADTLPVFAADHVYISIDRRPGQSSEDQVWHVGVDARDMQVNSSETWGVDIPEESRVRTIDRIGISMDLSPEKMTLSSAEVEWMDALVRVRGTLIRSPLPEEDRPVAKPRQKTFLPERITADQVREWERRLQAIRFSEGVVVDLSFLVDTADFAESMISYTVTAPSVNLSDVRFSQLSLRGSYHYPSVRIANAVLAQGHQSLRFSGMYDLDEKEVELNLSNTLASTNLLSLLPESARSSLSENGIRLDALPGLELQAGPVPVDKIMESMSGKFTLPGVVYGGARAEGIRGRFKLHEKGAELLGIQAMISGREDEAETFETCMRGGPVTGDVFWDSVENRIEIGLETRFDPHLVTDALSIIEAVPPIIDLTRFDAVPPNVLLDINARIGDGNSVVVKGRVLARDMRFRGESFSTADVPFVYRYPGIVELSPLAISRSASSGTGRVVLDFSRNQVEFDVETTLSPEVLENIIYPGLDLFGDELDITDSSISASGVFDWGGMTNTLFGGTVYAEKVSTPGVRIEKAYANVTGAGNLIKVKDVSFDIYGGSGTGDVTVLISRDDGPITYEIDMGIKSADIVELITHVSQTNLSSVSGRLNADLHVVADTSAEFLACADGEGVVHVVDGQLAELPFLSGFSKLIRKVYPGFNSFSITQFDGTFTMKDGVIRSEDAAFDGDFLSAKARGSYHYKEGLDIIMQARFFRSGPLGKVVHLVTDPFLKLLEFQVEGPLSDPSWHMVKLPKEVSRLFNWRDKDEKTSEKE